MAIWDNTHVSDLLAFDRKQRKKKKIDILA